MDSLKIIDRYLLMVYFLSQSQKVSEEVLKWEEGKKWQHKVETLKTKLVEKTKELEKAEKSLTLCRDALNRGDREKVSIQNKLKG